MRGSFLKGAVVGFVSAVLGGATVALAGSGINGVFNLGVSNSVNAKTTLTGSTAAAQLQVTNTSAAAGAAGLGVNSASSAPTGSFANSSTGIGVSAISASGIGVFARSGGASTPGLSARNTGGGPAGSFVVNAGVAPFTVSSTTKVGSLNADLLDGLDSAALQRRVTGTCAAGSAVRVVNANGSVSCQSVGGAGGGWSLTGNAGTSPGANFLGTTDVQDLVVKTNGNEALRVTQNGDVGIGTTIPTAKLHVDNNSASNPTVFATNAALSGTGGNFTGDIGLNVDVNHQFGIGLVSTLSGDTDGDGTTNNDGNQAIVAFTDDANSPNTFQVDNGGVPSDALTAEAIEAFGFVDINGSARVTGNLDVVGSCCTVADNPLDPAGSYLRHGTVASPEMKNIYDGVVTTDASGRATVELPDYFGAYNRDFRYQLTVVGVFAQAIVSKEIPAGGDMFEILTDKPNVKVSWQVTGVRDDAYAKAHPIQVVERKTGKTAGEYLHPELFGQPDATPLGVDGRARDASASPVSRRTGWTR